MKRLMFILSVIAFSLTFQSCGGDDGGGTVPPTDSDNDGVVNTADLCPGTPSGVSVNAQGCSAEQLDVDGDGVQNASDQCPNTPAGETVDSTGCSDSQLDDDGDNVSNAEDACPTIVGVPAFMGCPAINAAQHTFPINEDICVPDAAGQITHTASAGTGGSGGLEYRLHYADNENFTGEQTTAWSTSLSFAQNITAGDPVWAFWDTRDDVGNLRSGTTIKFRPEPDATSITAPNPAANIMVVDNTDGTATITWTESEANLNADVYILTQGTTDYSSSTTAATNITNQTATVNVNSGTWNAAVVLKKQFDNTSNTWRFEVGSYKQFQIP